MDGIHPTFLILAAITALVVFGPKRLPDLGGAVGRSLREFRRSLHGEGSEPAASEQPAPGAEGARSISPGIGPE